MLTLEEFNHEYQELIEARLPSRGKSWSIVELCHDAADYRRIVALWQGLGAVEWEIFSFSKKQEINLMLLTLLVNHARRHTRGDRIWNCMKTLPITQELRHTLFSNNGQPRQILRDRIESAAYYWNLRHVFDIPGHHSWFVTMFLQLGFSLPAAKKRLPYWLSGQIAPTASTYLQNGILRSDSFLSLWNALRSYRLNYSSEAKCQNSLKTNPWILDEWIPELLKLAKSKLHLIDFFQEEPEQQEPLILGPPQLVWKQSQDPVFRCEILAMMSFELEDDRYEIQIPGSEPVSLIRQENGDYYLSGDSYIEIPFKDAELHCRITSVSALCGSQEVGSQAIHLWERTYPVTLYRKENGHKIDDPENPERLDQGAYAIHHHSFEISPEALRNNRNGPWFVSEVPGVAKNEYLKLLLNGDDVWWPTEGEASIQLFNSNEIEVKVASLSSEVWTDPDSPPKCELSLYLPNGAELNWCRIGPEVIDFHEVSNHQYRSAPITLNEEQIVRALTLNLGFTFNSRRHRARKSINIEIFSFALKSQHSFKLYQSNRALNIRNSRGFLYHLSPPPVSPNLDERRNWILEGHRVIRSVPKRGFSLSDLAGYGESLYLSYGLYNTQEEPKELIERVRDNGVIRSIRFNADGFSLQTSSPIEFDEKHELIAWTMDHRFIRIYAQHLEQQYPDQWVCPFSSFHDGLSPNPKIKAIGLFYDGVRLGSWFDLRFYYSVTNISTEEEAERCAEMLRWFKAPVLDDEIASSMIFLFKNHIGQVMPVWLSSEKSPTLGLKGVQTGDTWLNVVSQLGRRTPINDLTIANARQALEAVYANFDPTNLQLTLPSALEALDGVGSNFVAKVCHLYLTEVSQGNLSGKPEKIIEAVRDRLKPSQEEVCQFCEQLSIDDRFLLETIKSALKPRSQLSHRDIQNIERLLSHRLTRQLLTSAYLKKINY